MRVAWRTLLLVGVANVVACRDATSDDEVAAGFESGLSVTPSTLVLRTLRDSARAVATVARQRSGQPPDIFWTVRDSTIARVSQGGMVYAAGQGVTTLIVRDQYGVRDSSEVRVEPPVTTLRIEPATVVAGVGRSKRFTVTLFDAQGVALRVAPGVVRWSSTRGTPPDSTRLVGGVSSVVFQARSPGVDTIRAEVDGLRASALLDVRHRFVLTSTADTIYTAVDAEPLHATPVFVASAEAGDTDTLRFTVQDPSVVQLELTKYSTPEAPRGLPRPAGLRPGITSMTVEAPGSPALRIPVVVSAFVFHPDSSVLHPVAGRAITAFYSVRDAASGARMVALKPLPYSLISTDTTAVLLKPRLVAPEPAGASVLGIPLITGDVGRSSYLVFQYGAQKADSTLVTMRSGAVLFSTASVNIVPTKETRFIAGLSHRVWYQPDRYPAQPTTIRFSHTNPGMTTWPDSIPVRTNQLQLWNRIEWNGLRPGTDTIVAFGPGLPGDTLILTLSPARFGPDVAPPPVYMGATARVGVDVLNRGSIVPLAFDLDVPVSVTSSDTSVLQLADSLVAVTSTPAGGATVTILPRRPGSANLTFRSSRSYSVPHTTSPIQVLPHPITFFRGLASQGRAGITLGMRQMTRSSFFSVGVKTPLLRDSIALRSSDTTIVQVSQGTLRLLGSGGAGFDVATGSRIGTAWVIASGRDLVADSFPVVVGQPRLVPFGGRFSSADSLTRWGFGVYAEGPPHSTRAYSRDRFVVSVTSSDPAVATLSVSEVVVEPGSDLSSGVRLRFARVPAAGAPLPSVYIRFRDTRNVPWRYADAVLEVSYERLESVSGRVGRSP